MRKLFAAALATASHPLTHRFAWLIMAYLAILAVEDLTSAVHGVASDVQYIGHAILAAGG